MSERPRFTEIEQLVIMMTGGVVAIGVVIGVCGFVLDYFSPRFGKGWAVLILLAMLVGPIVLWFAVRPLVREGYRELRRLFSRWRGDRGDGPPGGPYRGAQ